MESIREQNLRHLNNLVFLAKIDDHFDEREEDLVFEIGKHCGFTDPEIFEVIGNPKNLPISKPSSELEQFKHLYNVVNMMMVDGRLFQVELDYCVHVAMQLGFKKIIVNVLIKAIEDGLKLGLEEKVIREDVFALISE